MEGLSRMTDTEFAAWMRSLPREKTQEQVDSLIQGRDLEEGEYVNHNLFVHHFGEAGH